MGGSPIANNIVIIDPKIQNKFVKTPKATIYYEGEISSITLAQSVPNNPQAYPEINFETIITQIFKYYTIRAPIRLTQQAIL